MAKRKVEKMICTVSHEKPMPGGGFVQFEAGKEYPVGVVPGGSPYFQPVVEEGPGEEEEDDHGTT